VRVSSATLLDLVQDAMIIVDRAGLMIGERSAAFDRVFGAPRAGDSLARHLGLGEAQASALRGEFRRRGRIFEVRARRIEEPPGLVLVILADVTESRERVSFDRAAFQELLAATSAGAPRGELAERIRALPYDAASTVLGRLAQQGRAMATASGKATMAIQVDGGNVKLDGAFWEPFFRALSEAVRMAISAIEPPRERVAAGKSEKGLVCLRTAIDEDRLVIEVSDDGRGDPESEASPSSQLALETSVRAGATQTMVSKGHGTRRSFRFPPAGCSAVGPHVPQTPVTLRPGSGLRAAVRRDR
jgi:hypothetical protein